MRERERIRDPDGRGSDRVSEQDRETEEENAESAKMFIGFFCGISRKKPSFSATPTCSHKLWFAFLIFYKRDPKQTITLRQTFILATI